MVKDQAHFSASASDSMESPQARASPFYAVFMPQKLKQYPSLGMSVFSGNL